LITNLTNQLLSEISSLKRIPFETFEDFILPKVKSLGLDNHPYFEVMERVKSDKENWVKLFTRMDEVDDE